VNTSTATCSLGASIGTSMSALNTAMHAGNDTNRKGTSLSGDARDVALRTTTPATAHRP
jgi:hypothetical protein